MRPLTFVISLLFCVGSSLAQSQEKLYNNTTNQNNRLLLDTVQPSTPQREEMQPKPSMKRETIRKESTSKVKEDSGQSEKDSNSSIQQLKSAKFQFEKNYTDSRQQLTRRSASPDELFNMKQGAQIYTNLLPGSFEKHFYTYLLNKYNPEQFTELQLAAKLEPEKTEVQQELAAYGIAVNNQHLADSVALQMITQEKISEGLLTYGTDIINSIPLNGTLLVHGYTELIPVNFEKNNLGRNDIELISVDLLQSTDYRAALANKGFVIPNSTFVDTAFVQSFCALNTSRNLYLSMSFPKEYLLGMSALLTPVGLTFSYNQSSLFDHNTWNISLVETKWKKYELGIGKDAQSDALSANYLPTLLSVSKLYEAYNKREKAKEIEQIISQVAARARKTGQLSKIKR